MQNLDKQNFMRLLQATLAIYDKAATQETITLWWNLLECYEFCDIEAAFTRYLKSPEGRFSPKPASIIEIIDILNPDGRPGADEAWAAIPRDEYTSVVWTDEIAEAWGIAHPLLDEGDQVAARMAFKEAYSRIVENHKMLGIKPQWLPCLGFDKDGRESVLAEAVRLGHLTAPHAISLLAPDKVLPMLEMAGEKKLALEFKPISDSDRAARIAEMKAALQSKFITQGE